MTLRARRTIAAFAVAVAATTGVGVASLSTAPAASAALDRCPAGVDHQVTMQEKRWLGLGKTNKARWVMRRNPKTGFYMRGRDVDGIPKAHYRLHVRNRDWGLWSLISHMLLGRKDKDQWHAMYGPYSTIRVDCRNGFRRYLP